MTTSFLTPGAAAPPFALTALGSGRSVRPAGSSDALLLVFHDQNTVDVVQAMQEGLRSRYTDAGHAAGHRTSCPDNSHSRLCFIPGASRCTLNAWPCS